MTEKAKPRLVFNDTILRAYRRVDDLEAKLAALLIPILDGAADEAARNFAARATDPLTAAAKPRQSFSADAGDDAGVPTMIALLPHPDESRSLAEPGGHDPANLHVTLAYLGKTTGPLDAVRDALIPVAAAHAPLAGQVGGVGQFADNGEGSPAIALPSVPGLAELRVDVTRALTDAGIEYGRDYGFQPHITLDYRADPPGIEHAGKPLTFDSLWVVRGDTERLELSLVGAKPLTAAATGVEREIAEVADRYRPDPPDGYGNAWWNAERGKVYWICADWSTNEELEGAERDFRAIDGVEDVELCDECGPPSGDGRTCVYVAGRGLTASAAWSSPAPDEVIDVEALIRRLRTKLDPVRLAVVESVMKPVLDHAGIVFDATNPLTAKVLAQSGSQVTEIAQTTQLNVMRAIRHGYEQGLSIPDTAKAIRAGMKEASPARARLIARTELAGAANGGSLASVRIVNDAQGGGSSNFFKQWLCLAPGSRISAAGVYALIRKPYEGDLVRVTARVPAGRLRGAGPTTRRFTVTPDHLVLTTTGWIPAGLLESGSEIISAALDEWDAGRDPDVDHPEPLIEEVFDAALRSAGMVAAPVYLHGDQAVGEKVDVVGADGGLMDYGTAAGSQPLREFMLSLSDVGLDELLRGSAPPDRLVSHRGSGTRCATDSALLEEGGGVALVAGPVGFLLGSEDYPDLSQDRLDERVADSELASEALGGLARFVSSNEVIDVDRFAFSGHVYDCATLSGWFFADGVVAHNTAPGAQFPRHEDYDGLDGQTVHLDDTFTVGEDQLQFPGDPDGSPGEVCDCRCALAYTEDVSELTDGAGGIDA